MASGIIIAGWLALIIISQAEADLDRALADPATNATTSAIAGATTTVDQSTKLTQLDLGWHRAAADALWLTTIQYFGSYHPNQNYPDLYPRLRAITETDPQFEAPYLFGGIVLPWQGEPANALSLLEAGWRQFPNNGLFPYNAGAVAKIQLHDSALAARYFQAAADLPNSPPAAAVLAGVNLTELSDRDVALTWWESIVATTDNAAIKERAELWRDHLLLVIELERLIKQATADGQTVTTLDDLVTTGYLSAVPLSPLGAALRYNAAAGQVELVR